MHDSYRILIAMANLQESFKGTHKMRVKHQNHYCITGQGKGKKGGGGGVRTDRPSIFIGLYGSHFRLSLTLYFLKRTINYASSAGMTDSQTAQLLLGLFGADVL